MDDRHKIKELIKYEKDDIEWNKQFIRDLEKHKRNAINKGWVSATRLINDIIEITNKSILKSRMRIRQILKGE